MVVRPRPDVEWRTTDGAVFIIKVLRPECANGCIVRRLQPSFTYLWEKVTSPADQTFSDEEEELVKQLITLELVEEVG